MPSLQRPAVVAVDQVILHIIDPPRNNRRSQERARGLQLSETPVPPSTDPRVFTFFQNHVANALTDDNLRAAKFVVSAAGDGATDAPALVRHAVEELFRDPGRLVPASKTLAEQLYSVIEPWGTISTGDLAVCLCSGQGGDGDDDWSRFVALLKIDSAQGYPQVRRKVGGKEYYTVDLSAEVVEILPTPRQRLQKAAFLRPRKKGRAGYDMLLLDRQAAGQPGRVAEFFALDFLGARVVPLGAVAQTQIVWDLIVQERNAARPGWSDSERKDHEAKVESALKQKEIGIEDLAKVFTGEGRRRLAAALRAELPSERVEIDPDYAARITARRKFRGDGQLKVEALASAWPKLLRSATLVRTAAGKAYWKIVLHTKTWEEVK